MFCATAFAGDSTRRLPWILELRSIKNDQALQKHYHFQEKKTESQKHTNYLFFFYRFTIFWKIVYQRTRRYSILMTFSVLLFWPSFLIKGFWSVSLLTMFAQKWACTVYRRAERSLFVQGHFKMFSFLSCPWRPSAFQLYKSNFLGTYWSDSSNFCINTTTGSRSIIFQTFDRRKVFSASYWRQKFQFLEILESIVRIFESCLYSKLGNAKFFQYLMSLHSIEPRAVIILAKNEFPASFRQKKRAEKLEFFRNRFDIPHCPLHFFHFLQTYSQYPFTYCLVALTTSWLIGAEVFNSLNYSAIGFLAKTIENPDFFRGQGLLSCISLNF